MEKIITNLFEFFIKLKIVVVSTLCMLNLFFLLPYIDIAEKYGLHPVSLAIGMITISLLCTHDCSLPCISINSQRFYKGLGLKLDILKPMYLVTAIGISLLGSTPSHLYCAS